MISISIFKILFNLQFTYFYLNLNKISLINDNKCICNYSSIRQNLCNTARIVKNSIFFLYGRYLLVITARIDNFCIGGTAQARAVPPE